MFKFIKDIFTEANGTVWDIKRILSASGMCSFIGLGGYSLIQLHQHFDWSAAGLGIASIIGASGGAIMMGRKGEAQADDDDPPTPTAPDGKPI